MASLYSYFNGRELAIVTKHQKEKAIIPEFKVNFDLSYRVVEGVDTDLLGTFTGEVKRVLSPIESARKKCALAAELNDCDLIIANEGSFGPHPSAFFLPADYEIIHFMDVKNNWSLTEYLLSTDTNFAAKEINTVRELKEFAAEACFPEHKLILRLKKNDSEGIVKDLKNEYDLFQAFEQILETYGSVYVETDMRAMNNPKRMKVIASLTQKLVKRLLIACPQCSNPGFGFKEFIVGLPCEACANPTQKPMAEKHFCSFCKFEESYDIQGGHALADPANCVFCNP